MNTNGLPVFSDNCIISVILAQCTSPAAPPKLAEHSVSLTTSYPIEQQGERNRTGVKNRKKSTFFAGTRKSEKSEVVVSYCPAISASQNGPQRAPEVSRQLPELRNSGAKRKFRCAIA